MITRFICFHHASYYVWLDLWKPFQIAHWKLSIWKILKHYNQPRIVSTWIKLTQRVGHFTVFKSFPSTSCCSQKFPPNNFKKKAGLSCEVVSGMLSLGGWWGWTGGKRLQFKIAVGHQWSPKTSLEELCWLLNGWNEAQSTVWAWGLPKEAATLDIASPDTCQCLKPPFEPFTSPWIHPCYNQPWVSRSKFRLKTNSTVHLYMLVVLVWFCLMCNLERFL